MYDRYDDYEEFEDLQDDAGFDDYEMESEDMDYIPARNMDDGFEELSDDFDAEDMAGYGDLFDESDFYEDDEDLEDQFCDAMAYALGAEDTDEFFMKALRKIGGLAGGLFRGVKRMAPMLSKFASFIPGPYGSMISGGLRLLQNLRYEGATEDDALEAFAELSVYDEAAVPIAAALAVKSLAKGKTKKMPLATRKKLVKDLVRATRHMMNNSGSPKSVRALPKIIRSVKRSSTAKGTPQAMRPMVAKKIIAKIANNPRLVKKLARPSMKGKAIVQKSVRRPARAEVW